MNDYSGIMSAVVTPINGDRTVNEEQLKRLLEFQLENGIHSILALGGTGEYPNLTAAERKHMVEATIRMVDHRVPVIIGDLETGIGESIAFTKYCEEAGADAVLVMTPYYVHPSQQGIIDFYMELDRQVNIDLMVYNIPYRTGVNITAESFEYLVDHMQHLAGIKECNNSPAQAIDMLNRVGSRTNVLSGEEFLAVMLMAMGAKGAVMASANLIPDGWVRMYELTREGRAGEALTLFKRYSELLGAMFSEVNPGPLKYGMTLLGVPCGPVATPLCPPSGKTKARMEAALKELGLI